MTQAPSDNSNELFPDDSTASTSGDQTHPTVNLCSPSFLSPAADASASTPRPPPSSSLDPSYSYPAALLYPSVTPHLHTTPFSILSTPSAGRGLFATSALPANTLLEIAPVLLLSSSEYASISHTVLRGYVFTWSGAEGGMALALGMGSLFNHSESANVSFEIDTKGYVIRFRTVRNVREGEELCIFYGFQAHFEGGEQGECLKAEVEVLADEWGWMRDIQNDEDDKEEEDILDVVEGRREDKKGKGKEVQVKWQEDVVLFEELEWKRVTSAIDEERRELETMDCWAVDIPAKHVQLLFKFTRQHNPASIDLISHLKRIRISTPTSSSPSLSASPTPPSTSTTGDSLLTVLLFPVSSSLPALPSLLSTSPDLSPFNLSTTLRVIPVPSHVARTAEQAREWSKVWPVQMVHIREGSRATPKAKGWERVKVDWIRSEAEKVWQAAREAGLKGEHPIACHVTDTFDAQYHSPLSLPLTHAISHDTRHSSSHPLSHAALNVIHSISHLDLSSARAAPLSPSLPVPYLLTGLSVFMSHEPCLMCSMALLHSRIAALYFVKRSEGSGGCGSVYSVMEDKGLNHKFEVWEWKGEKEHEGFGDGLEVEADP